MNPRAGKLSLSGFHSLMMAQQNEALDPALRTEEIATAAVEGAGLDTVMTNSFGFGGTNGSMLLSRHQDGGAPR